MRHTAVVTIFERQIVINSIEIRTGGDFFLYGCYLEWNNTNAFCCNANRLYRYKLKQKNLTVPICNVEKVYVFLDHK